MISTPKNCKFEAYRKKILQGHGKHTNKLTLGITFGENGRF